MTPVCPVARKAAGTPRPCSALVGVNAVYFLPNAQSVPIVNTRRPLRLRPVLAPRVAAPVAEPKGSLGAQAVLLVADEQEIWLAKLVHVPPSMQARSVGGRYKSNDIMTGV